MATPENKAMKNRPAALAIPTRGSVKIDPNIPRSPESGGASPGTTSPRLVSARVRNPTKKGNEILELVDLAGDMCSPDNKQYGFLAKYGIVDSKGGAGAYGVVSRMMRLDLSEREWAVKKTPKALFAEHHARVGDGSKDAPQQTSDSKKERFRIVMEAVMNIEKKEQHVVPIEQIYEDSEFYYTVMPHCHSSLKEYLAFNLHMSEKTIKDFTYQMLCGIGSLHKRESHHVTEDGKEEVYCGLLHRDLKPDNILVMDMNDSHLGICDFDLSMFKNMTDDSIVGTPGYIDPQVMELDQYSERSDLYSIGCVLFQMLTAMKSPTGLSLPPDVSPLHGHKSRNVSFADSTETELGLEWQKKVCDCIKNMLTTDEGRGKKKEDINEALRRITLDCLTKAKLCHPYPKDKRTGSGIKQADFKNGWMRFNNAMPDDDVPDQPGYYLQYVEIEIPEGMDIPNDTESARQTARLIKVKNHKCCGFVEMPGDDDEVDYVYFKREIVKLAGSPHSPRGSRASPANTTSDLSKALDESKTEESLIADELKGLALQQRSKEMPKTMRKEGMTFHYLLPSAALCPPEPNSPAGEAETVDLHKLLYCLLAPVNRDQESPSNTGSPTQANAEPGTPKSPKGGDSCPTSPRLNRDTLIRANTAEEVKLKFWGVQESPSASPRKRRSTKKRTSNMDALLAMDEPSSPRGSPPGSPRMGNASPAF